MGHQAATGWLHAKLYTHPDSLKHQESWAVHPESYQSLRKCCILQLLWAFGQMLHIAQTAIQALHLKNYVGANSPLCGIEGFLLQVLRTANVLLISQSINPELALTCMHFSC